MKTKFPIAQIRDDGTPAIWLTHTHWLILKDGIIRAYLENRKSLGRLRARRDRRKELGSAHRNKRLTDWEFLDSWPQDQSNIEASMDLFLAGHNAWGHIGARAPGGEFWTPEKLREIGDREEFKAYTEELKTIDESQPQQAPI